MSEKRSYTRAQTRIRGHARRVASRDSLPLLYESPGLAERPKDDLAGANLSPGLLSFLQAMDAKLDMLLNHFLQERLGREYPAAVEVVELGGGGCAFSPPSGFAAGDVLEIAFVLSQNPLRLASAVGAVTRIEERAGEAVAVVEFTRIRETDQEAVVSFVFKEERERIRQAKWEEA